MGLGDVALCQLSYQRQSVLSTPWNINMIRLRDSQLQNRRWCWIHALSLWYLFLPKKYLYRPLDKVLCVYKNYLISEEPVFDSNSSRAEASCYNSETLLRTHPLQPPQHFHTAWWSAHQENWKLQRTPYILENLPWPCWTRGTAERR